MKEIKLLTLKRQREIILINRVLATMVVVLMFSTGILLAITEQWVVKPAAFPQTTATALEGEVRLPVPTPTDGSLNAILSRSRYDRSLAATALTQTDLLSLVWAAQGQITPWGERTVPSYKSRFPIQMGIYVRQVVGIPNGYYLLDAASQELKLVSTSLPLLLPPEVPALTQAPVLFVAHVPVEADPIALVEAGAVSQNILLKATELGLATFQLPASFFNLEPESELVWVMPIGLPLDSNYSKVEL